ncbi:hypothetical protein IQ06DRAFT_138276 [Phaeosphaeriaceae sp. SRC1lsM3a]|nr:hypothetical protein IQ06DRAFT_138276 [Stagonospora sp. SRC1lsM3a]
MDSRGQRHKLAGRGARRRRRLVVVVVGGRNVVAAVSAGRAVSIVNAGAGGGSGHLQEHCAMHVSAAARAEQDAQCNGRDGGRRRPGGDFEDRRDKKASVRLSRSVQWGGGGLEAEVVGMLVLILGSGASQPEPLRER